MSKNLDHLFQEKLKSFEEVPDEKVWKSIEASLDKKKKNQKFIPIWWRLAGVAAALAILLYVINPFENTADSNIIITDIENTNTPNTDVKTSTDKDLVPADQNNGEQVVSTDDIDLEENNKSDATKNPSYVVNDAISEKPSNKSTEKSSQLTTIDNSKKEADNSVDFKKSESFSLPSNTNKEAVAIVDETGASKKNVDFKNEEAVQSILNETNTKEAIVLGEDEKKDIEKNASKKSIFDEIKEADEEEVVAENNTKKWSVGPSIAPVYFNGI